MRWSLERTEEILHSPSSSGWNNRWLEVLHEADRDGDLALGGSARIICLSQHCMTARYSTPQCTVLQKSPGFCTSPLPYLSAFAHPAKAFTRRSQNSDLETPRRTG